MLTSPHAFLNVSAASTANPIESANSLIASASFSSPYAVLPSSVPNVLFSSLKRLIFCVLSSIILPSLSKSACKFSVLTISSSFMYLAASSSVLLIKSALFSLLESAYTFSIASDTSLNDLATFSRRSMLLLSSSRYSLTFLLNFSYILYSLSNSLAESFANLLFLAKISFKAPISVSNCSRLLSTSSRFLSASFKELLKSS